MVLHRSLWQLMMKLVPLLVSTRLLMDATLLLAWTILKSSYGILLLTDRFVYCDWCSLHSICAFLCWSFNLLTWWYLQVRTLRGGHRSRVGALAWNNHILITGGMDGQIINNDVRIRSHIVETYRGHQQEVCGLKWSASGQQLASGGNDNLVHIWDRSLASSLNSATQWLHRLQEHTSGVKALALCPFQGERRELQAGW